MKTPPSDPAPHPSPLAGKKLPSEALTDTEALLTAYFEKVPNPETPSELVAFGTSGHRGSPLLGTFTESHVLAITQAICEIRKSHGFSGPLYMGMDTHCTSDLAQKSALEVLAANRVDVILQESNGFTPTPVISRSILRHNAASNGAGRADGIIITPSHNPPDDAGIKYNPPHGGPAEGTFTKAIQDRANAILRSGNREVKRIPYREALTASTTTQKDLAGPYIDELDQAIDMASIAKAGIAVGVHPLGGASVAYWERIAERYGLKLTVVDATVDPAFGFMTADHDGKIRMDCSSPYAMASLIEMKNTFRVAFGTDPDADRHGIVTPAAGLLNPNHYLAIAIDYLLQNRPNWSRTARVGKTIVSSTLIDRVVSGAERGLFEVPVGFKWFAGGLFDGSICFGGEESAGASFLARDGSAWSTDKDGILLSLLAAEITARTGEDLAVYLDRLFEKYGSSSYTRVDAPITVEQKSKLAALSAASLSLQQLAGDPVVTILDRAPGNNEGIGGVKIETANGWGAVRPSGTEPILKIYAESRVGEGHLREIIAGVRAAVGV